MMPTQIEAPNSDSKHSKHTVKTCSICNRTLKACCGEVFLRPGNIGAIVSATIVSTNTVFIYAMITAKCPECGLEEKVEIRK